MYIFQERLDKIPKENRERLIQQLEEILKEERVYSGKKCKAFKEALGVSMDDYGCDFCPINVDVVCSNTLGQLVGESIKKRRIVLELIVKRIKNEN